MGKARRSVSVVIPARNEAATVGHVVSVCRSLPDVVDQVVVVDDASDDGTGAAAAAAGAVVVPGPGRGKGAAMRAGLAAATGCVVVFADADVTSFDGGFVTGLVAPMLERDDIVFVKGAYARPGEGGRVNELVARPMLALLFPELSHIEQPLGGEYAGLRAVFESVPFEDGYGVDIGLLLDIAARHGAGAITQVDLGVRAHRNRPLSELRGTAQEVMSVVFDRAGVDLPVVRRLA